ncbi:hypothetical protein DYQ91_03595 [Xanthomonas sp. LMG 8989]|nr:hypothetical protein [Xanthomonas sp. LMG 8989]
MHCRGDAASAHLQGFRGTEPKGFGNHHPAEQRLHGASIAQVRIRANPVLEAATSWLDAASQF